MKEKLKNIALGGAFYLLNLRFLPQATKVTIKKIAEALNFFIKHIDPQLRSYTAKGPKTYCPICSIPVVGMRNYIKQNFKNLTNTIQMAKTNFNATQLVTKTLHVSSKNLIIMLAPLLSPFRRMRIGNHRRSSQRRKWDLNNEKIGQLDGSDDPNDWSSDSEEEDNSSADMGYMEADSGWYRKPMPKFPKGIAYWYNPKRPKNKYSELKNAPKMNPPVLQTRGDNQQNDTEDDFIEDEEEINITMSETIRTKIVNINVRSAVSDYKKAQIREGIRKIDPDVIVITESWLNKYDQEFRIAGYVPIGRQDRPPPRNKEPNPKKRGGGVLVLAKKEVDIKYVHEESPRLPTNQICHGQTHDICNIQNGQA